MSDGHVGPMGDAAFKRLIPLALVFEWGIRLYCHDDFGSGGNNAVGMIGD